MEVITIESAAFKELIQKLDEVKKSVLSSNCPPADTETWLPSAEVLKLLKISKRTLQSYRDKGILPFSQFGAKIYFKEKDILDHLNRNYIRSNGKD